MSDWANLSQRLQSALQLSQSPVAITFLDEVPANAQMPEAPVPAGCSFWQLGTSATISTDAAHHRFCSIGIHTHSLAHAPDTQPHELQSALAAMQGLDYVRLEEVEALPVMKESAKHVVYGPLEEASERPAMVMLFANAAQGLIVTEALSRVDGEVPPAMGRPACALVPQVVNQGRSASSLGCCGARAYLEALSDEVTLWGLAGEKLEAYVGAVETLAKANTVLTKFHENRRAAIESGSSPTVEESLATLA